MMRQTMLHILLAGTFGALAAAGSVQAIAPSQGKTSDNATQTDTEHGRSSANENGSTNAQNAGDVTQSQSDQPATDKMDGTRSRNVPQKHPPTSVMDRATPNEKAPEQQSARKHPPTNRMDRETPEQASPDATSDTASGGAAKTE
jgi:hypothetical protein